MIEILRAGMLTSVQDLGRSGYRQLGIGPGGALDQLALTLANRLVGNPASCAGLEITMGACELRFTSATRVALTGGEFDATLDGVPVWSHWSFPVRAGQTLKLGNTNTAARPGGMRAYLAVAGGIDVPLVLGSRSTDLKAGFGGHAGRALRDGDCLPIATPSANTISPDAPAFGIRSPAWFGLNASTRSDSPDGCDAVTLRVLPGPEFEQFTATARKMLWDHEWRVTPNSNRMGYRLSGPELTRKKAGDLLSHGVLPGVIQVPPSGQPIILLGDAQTTGGYPKIGVVISADLWQLAQVPLGAMLRLVRCDLAEAHRALERQSQYLATVEQALQAARWNHVARPDKRKDHANRSQRRPG